MTCNVRSTGFAVRTACTALHDLPVCHCVHRTTPSASNAQHSVQCGDPPPVRWTHHTRQPSPAPPVDHRAQCRCGSDRLRALTKRAAAVVVCPQYATALYGYKYAAAAAAAAQVNSFEQLCINYANEKLQQLFFTHVVKAETALYSAEGIGAAAADHSADNIDCLEAMQMQLQMRSRASRASAAHKIDPVPAKRHGTARNRWHMALHGIAATHL